MPVPAPDHLMELADLVARECPGCQLLIWDGSDGVVTVQEQSARMRMEGKYVFSARMVMSVRNSPRKITIEYQDTDFVVRSSEVWGVIHQLI
jgi:hypothetical protein